MKEVCLSGIRGGGGGFVDGGADWKQSLETGIDDYPVYENVNEIGRGGGYHR